MSLRHSIEFLHAKHKRQITNLFIYKLPAVIYGSGPYLKSIRQVFRGIIITPTMKLEKEYIDYLRLLTATIQNKEQLLIVLNEAREILYGANSKLIRKKALTYYSNPDIAKDRYRTFSIKKKSGADRIINAPAKGLKKILRCLNLLLVVNTEAHEAATGFVWGKSVVDNARVHVGKRYVYNLDLKDFFHSFDRNRVKMAFMAAPFHFKGEREPLAFFLACLCTHPFEIEGGVKTVLPQGSPTSPTLTNILCERLDKRLSGLAKRFKLSYTRYADDITFSSHEHVFDDDVFQQELKRIIEEDQQLHINPSKTRLQEKSYRQEATGLVVNEKVNVRRRYVKQIRMWLYYWEKYGYEHAEEIFKKDYFADKGHVKNMNAPLSNVLRGKLEFLKMVKGADDSTFITLKNRFLKLGGDMDLIENVLQTWEEKGIEQAMDTFYKKNPL
jgi:RNA-directed DNA polymerase